MGETQELIDKIKGILQAGFPNAVVELEQAVPSTKVAGLLICPDFEGVEQIERQDLLWNVLSKNLTRPEQLQITAILTLTPEERTVSQER